MTRRSREILVRSGPNIPWAPAGVPVTPGTEYDRTLNSQLVPSDVLIAEFQSGTSQSYSKSIQSAIGNIADTLIATTGEPHEHFEIESQDVDVLWAIPFRSTDDLGSWGNVNWANKWSYDSTEDAIVATFSSEILDLAGNEQIWIDSWDLHPGNSNGVSIELEVRWSNNWFVPAARPNFASHKLLRMDKDGQGHLHLPAINYNTGWCTGCALPNVWMGGGSDPQVILDEPDFDSNRDPIRAIWGTPSTFDVQPGGDTGWSYADRPTAYATHLGSAFSNGIPAPFLVGPNRWVRFNWWWTWSGGDTETYFWGWASDEENDPVQTFGSIARPGDGLKLQNSNFANCGGDLFRIEIDTSDDHAGDEGIGNFQIWVRNFILRRDTPIDIEAGNSRPISSS